jgi:hypothetical protein
MTTITLNQSLPKISSSDVSSFLALGINDFLRRDAERKDKYLRLIPVSRGLRFLTNMQISTRLSEQIPIVG